MKGTWISEHFTSPTGNVHRLTLHLEEPAGDAVIVGSLRVVSDRKDGRKIDTQVPLIVQTQGEVAVMMASGVNAAEGLLALLVKRQTEESQSGSAPSLTGQLVWHSLSDGTIRSQAIEFHPKGG